MSRERALRKQALAAEKEALERQTATADILKVISSSPTDTQPVFDIIAERAVALCGGEVSVVSRFDGASMQLAAVHGITSEGVEALRKIYPLPLDAETATTRAFRSRSVVHLADVVADASYQQKATAVAAGWRSALAVPMVRGPEVIGVIFVGRSTTGFCTESQVELLKTFAAQAVIAIENARLFNETKEALEQQTASNGVLEVISKSPSDLSPVFDAILASATRLCDAHLGVLNLWDGENCRTVSQRGGKPEFVKWVLGGGAFKPDPATSLARAIEEREPIQVLDLKEAPAFRAGVARSLKFVELGGARTHLTVPLVKEERVLGTIAIYRSEVRAFSTKQIELVKTFAKQAVIAIENVRLFNETKEALEQQTATSEVLGVISRSPTDLRPVFEAILRSATELCEAHLGFLDLYDGEKLRTVAQRGGDAAVAKWALERGAFRPDSDFLRQVIAERRPSQIADLREDSGYRERRPNSTKFVELGGARTFLAVPLLKDDKVVGNIAIYRPEVRPFTDKQIALVNTFANQAVIAIENARLFNETKEALEREKASAEILKVISSSPTATQPVFESIVQKCHALYEDSRVALRLIDDGRLVTRASTEAGAFEPMPIDRESGLGACVLEARTIHLPDLEAAAEQYPRLRQLGLVHGYRSGMFAPLLQEGRAIGGISVLHRQPGAFSDKDVALLTTFADQAVIAIQNAHQFHETREALEQQTAISEVLRIISDSPTDVNPVLEAVAMRAAKICEASDARIWLVDGGSVRLAAGFGDVPMPLAAGESLPLDRGWISGRAILDRTLLHIEDSASLSPDEYPITHKLQQRSGMRTTLSVPLMRESRALGAIMLRRKEVRRFSDKQVALLKTFSDQAAIAIENVRLFNETKEALERQRATSEVLGVISSSPTDVAPVYRAILDNVTRLCEANIAALFLYDGEFLTTAAHCNATPDFASYLDGLRIAPSRETPSRRAALERRIVHVEDALSDPSFSLTARHLGERFRTVLSVPLLREGELAGVITIWRREPRLFTDQQVALVKTFADQAVIAIENVRLFKELQERTEALTKSVGQLTALGEVGQAISSTLDLEKVLKTIVQRAVQLAGLDGGSIYEFDERDERFHLRAAEHVEEAILEMSRRSPIRLGEGTVGHAGAIREPVVVEDVLDKSYQSRARELLIKAGSRALLVVPLLREDLLFGALVVYRKSPGAFAPEVIDLLKTFATQSAVAIQNAKLFREIQEKSAQLEVANKHKSDFLANMSHELRTPLNAIIGFSEALMDQMFGDLNEKQLEYQKDVHESGKHLLSLINDILDLSKIEAGRMELELSSFHLPTTVSNAVTLIRERAMRHGIALGVEIDERLGDFQADERKVKQVLLNLLSNAVKFTPDGGRVDVSAKLDTNKVEIAVKDTGVGISPEDQASLFEEFKQLGKDSSRKAEGTGLGLALTKRLVELHGGQILVNSVVGHGSTFCVTLPVRGDG